MKTLLLFLIVLVCTYSSAREEWKLERNKNGIKVYTRSVSGSDIREFKALTTFNAPRLKIAEVLTRITDYQNWFPDVTDSRVLRIINSRERIIYYRVDVPWPAADRDCVMHLKVIPNEAKGETLLTMVDKNDEMPYLPGVERMAKVDGYWKLSTIGEKTNIHYQFLADPGGNLPDWLVNMFLVDGPFDTVSALKKKVE